MTDVEHIAILEEEIRWLTDTCSIKDAQHQALLALLHSQRETYISRMIPHED